MTDQSYLSLDGCRIILGNEMRLGYRLLENLMPWEVEIADELYSLLWLAEGMLRSADVAGITAHTALLANYQTWASHRKFLGHC